MDSFALRSRTSSRRAGAAMAALLLAVPSMAAAQTATSAAAIDKSVKVGAGVYEIVASSKNDAIYAASIGTRAAPAPKIFVLDPKTLAVRTTIDLAQTPAFGLGLNDRTGTLYGTDTRGAAVVVVDLASGKVTKVLKSAEDTAAHLREVVVDEDANVAYASSYDKAGKVWVIDGASQTIKRVLTDVGNGTTGLALDKAGNRLFTANMGGNDLSVIDLKTLAVVKRIPAGGERPTNVAFDPKKGRLYVANQGTGDLTVIDAEAGTLIKAIKTGAGALGVSFDPALDRIYVANRGAGTVTVVDGGSLEVVADLATGSHPNTVAIDRRTNVAYVTNKAKSGGRGAPPVDDPNGDTVTRIKP